MSDVHNPIARAASAPDWLQKHWVPLATPMLPAYVARIIDGDSFVCWARVPLYDYPAYPTVRLAVVDAPESFHPRSPAEAALAAKATAFAVSVLAGKQVALIPTGAYKDDRNRWIARILYKDARGNACDYGEALTKRRLTKLDIPDFAAVLETKDAAQIASWGTTA